MNMKMSSMLFGDTMVPNLEEDYIILLGYSVLYEEYYLTGFNHHEASPGAPNLNPKPRNLLGVRREYGNVSSLGFRVRRAYGHML